MKSFFKIAPLVLVLYSVVHFVSSSGVIKENIGGDFLSAFPSFWAWKINPKLIQGNSRVIGFMGEEYIELGKNTCETSIGYFGPIPVCKRLYFREDGSAPKPVTVKNQSWNYGPALHFVTFPLLFLPSFEVALRTWHVLTVGFYLGAAAIWYYLLIFLRGLHTLPVLSVFIAIWFNFSGTYDALLGPEIEVFQFFAFSVGLLLFLRRRVVGGGIIFGLAAMAKFTPIGFLPFLALKKHFRFCVAALISIFIITILAEMTLGWEWSFTRRLLLPFGDTTTSSNSQSITSWIHRLFSDFDIWRDSTPYLLSPSVSNPKAAIQTSRVVLFLIAAFYSFLFLRFHSKPILDVELGILFILMTTLIQWNHMYYLVPVPVAYTIALSHLALRARNGEQTLAEGCLLVFSYFLVGYFLPGTFYHKVFEVFNIRFYEAYTVYSIPVYGCLVLLGWLTYQYMRGRGRPLTALPGTGLP